MSQCLEGRFPPEFAVAIGAIVLVFVGQGCPSKLSHGCDRNLGEELLAVMVIELFDHAIAPRFSRGDEPQIDSIEQAEADKRPHSPRVDWTTEEGHFVVYLKIVGNTHTLPERIESV